ncbi:M48 family metallopeptidase [Sphingomonas piscis]|uniref:M48 family metallopeptidase n=1 Tax=Sphingomonas piscis TaxID=2714943 RepID=A0A6G7YPP7_9SPHN|nr:SprT family zinc-dependent metalloprotease [Sphingomonas piscis]QIK78711.1 M48 family metallopeptidase [Sphingomonas piscis]
MAELLRLEALPVPLELRPMRSARRVRLRYDEVRQVLRMTCPAGLSRRRALTWASEQQDWVLAQIARAGEQEVLCDGAVIPLEGQEVRLRWVDSAARTPVIVGGELIGGGPPACFGMRVERFLRDRALQLLSAETQEYAAKAGVSCRSVGVGDASSRWGSCSADGRIRYSWRLIMAPPAARRFVVAHEVAHLVHLNHGPKFKALEDELLEGDVQAARALLRQVGPRLRRVVGRL